MGVAIDCGTGIETAVPAPEVPIDVLFAARLAELADIRWLHETGGIVVAGTPIKTDRESQGLLTTAYCMAKFDPSFSVNWKAGNGLFIPANASLITEVGDAVTAHVQGCFAREGQLTLLLAAAFAAEDAAALAAIDITAGWP